MEQHFVQFFSPGTFMSESTVCAIAEWNIDTVVEMARAATARPYGFQFLTRNEKHETARSGMHYFGGEQVTGQRGWPNMIVTSAPCADGSRPVNAFYDGDVVLDVVL